MHEADEAQLRQSAAGIVRGEVALPFGEAVVIRETIVESTEVKIGIRSQRGVGGIRDLRTARERIFEKRNLQCRVRPRQRLIAGEVDEEAIVADGKSAPQRGIPKVAGILLVAWAVGSRGVGRSGQQIGILRIQGICLQPLRQRRERDIDIPIGPLRIV